MNDEETLNLLQEIGDKIKGQDEVSNLLKALQEKLTNWSVITN